MAQNYQDAMSIVRKFGKPDLFLTVTCNPHWREINASLLHGQKPQDRPDIVAFKQNLDAIIWKKSYFGIPSAFVYVIEFQKRGLPHAHLLIILR